MRVLLLLITIFASSLAKEILDYNVENIKFELDEELVKHFLDKYEEGDDDGIVAIVDEYADKIFANIATFAVENNLDPLNITDIEEDFLASSVTLTEGTLNGISTIGRSDNVTINYSSSSKIMEMYFPIEFIDLSFTYKYHVIILLIGPKGRMTGEIKELKMNIGLQFDFNTYHATITEVETSNKGQVTLKFHGNGVVDAVVNLLTKFVTLILHPLIASSIEKIVTNVAQLVADTINSVIDSILYPATSTSSIF